MLILYLHGGNRTWHYNWQGAMLLRSHYPEYNSEKTESVYATVCSATSDTGELYDCFFRRKALPMAI